MTENDCLKQHSIGVLRKRCSENMQQITGEQPCISIISIKMLCNFIAITLRHGCYHVNNTLTWVFFSNFLSTCGGLLLNYPISKKGGISNHTFAYYTLTWSFGSSNTFKIRKIFLIWCFELTSFFSHQFNWMTSRDISWSLFNTSTT